MSSSTVTYTSVDTDFEPWRFQWVSDEEPSKAGSPRVIVYGYDGLPMDPLDPYVEAAMHVPASPDYVPSPMYPEYAPPDDEVFLAEEQPLPAVVSPTADSPGYTADSEPEEEDPEMDLEEEDPKMDPEEKEEPEVDPVDYLSDVEIDEEEGDEEESEGDSIDYPSTQEEEEKPFEEEEEHIAPNVPASATPSSPPTSPHHIIPFPLTGRRTERMLVRPQPAMAASTDALIAAITAALPPLPPPSSLLALLPPPIILPRTRANMVMMRAAAPSTYILAPRSQTPPSGTPPLLPIPLPTASLPLPLPPTDHRADVPKVLLLPRKRLFIAPSPRYEVKESSFAIAARPTRGFRTDYGFVGTLDAKIRRDPEREDTNEIYVSLNDVQDDQALITVHGCSHLARYEVITLRTTVSALQAENGKLQASYRIRQTQLLETLTYMRALQDQMTILQRHRTKDNDRLTQHI
ncbi:hypothetical protein Tco_0267444 [Tanacetum coccineum]